MLGNTTVGDMERLLNTQYFTFTASKNVLTEGKVSASPVSVVRCAEYTVRACARACVCLLSAPRASW